MWRFERPLAVPGGGDLAPTLRVTAAHLEEHLGGGMVILEADVHHFEFRATLRSSLQQGTQGTEGAGKSLGVLLAHFGLLFGSGPWRGHVHGQAFAKGHQLPVTHGTAPEVLRQESRKLFRLEILRVDEQLGEGLHPGRDPFAETFALPSGLIGIDFLELVRQAFVHFQRARTAGDLAALRAGGALREHHRCCARGKHEERRDPGIGSGHTRW